MTFFPYEEGVIEPGGTQVFSKQNAAYGLEIPLANQRTEKVSRLSGVLVSRTKDAKRAIAVELDVPVVRQTAGILNMGGTSAAATTIVAGILLAFAGGLVLNLMPCVLPVLSIKALSFLNEDGRNPRKEGLLYGCGVIISFWLLAGILLLLKALGKELGWGFHLQSPIVVTALALLFFVLALNLSGLFEVRRVLPGLLNFTTPKSPKSEALLSGVLAVVVASPCTGPFMGAALGFALTQSVTTTFAVFTALAIGFALPYVLFAWLPQARRMLPKPGAWMEKFRQFLAFPLLATVVWLAWVLGLQSGMEAVIGLLAALLIISLMAWTARSFDPSRTTRAAMVLLFVVAVIPLGTVGRAPGEATSSSSSTSPNWGEYSKLAVQEANARGKTVSVDFTAAWCITCQVNKHLVLDRPETKQLFESTDTIPLRADWTLRDAAIAADLHELGRSGVPTYLIQKPGKPPQLLPEVLSKGILAQALTQAKDPQKITKNRREQ